MSVRFVQEGKNGEKRNHSTFLDYNTGLEARELLRESQYGEFEKYTKGVGSKILHAHGFQGRLGKHGTGRLNPLYSGFTPHVKASGNDKRGLGASDAASKLSKKRKAIAQRGSNSNSLKKMKQNKNGTKENEQKLTASLKAQRAPRYPPLRVLGSSPDLNSSSLYPSSSPSFSSSSLSAPTKIAREYNCLLFHASVLSINGPRLHLLAWLHALEVSLTDSLSSPSSTHSRRSPPLSSSSIWKTFLNDGESEMLTACLCDQEVVQYFLCQLQKRLSARLAQNATDSEPREHKSSQGKCRLGSTWDSGKERDDLHDRAVYARLLYLVTTREFSSLFGKIKMAQEISELESEFAQWATDLIQHKDHLYIQSTEATPLLPIPSLDKFIKENKQKGWHFGLIHPGDRQRANWDIEKLFSDSHPFAIVVLGQNLIPTWPQSAEELRTWRSRVPYSELYIEVTSRLRVAISESLLVCISPRTVMDAHSIGLPAIVVDHPCNHGIAFFGPFWRLPLAATRELGFPPPPPPPPSASASSSGSDLETKKKK